MSTPATDDCGEDADADDLQQRAVPSGNGSALREGGSGSGGGSAGDAKDGRASTESSHLVMRRGALVPPKMTGEMDEDDELLSPSPSPAPSANSTASERMAPPPTLPQGQPQFRHKKTSLG